LGTPPPPFRPRRGGGVGDDNFSTKKSKRQQVFRACLKECEMQIEKTLDNKIFVSHIDSHHHIHTLPLMIPIIPKLIKKFHIKKWRISKNIYILPYRCSFKKIVLKKIWNSYLSNVCFAKTTDYFCDFISFVKSQKKELKKHAIIELMTHPGKDFSIEESGILESNWIKSMSCPVELISYNALF
jgi:predicted glycoside hydrolase/deacetylase ChbG (UPF0249 family)